MISNLKYLPINWKNGMSFSEDHLNKQYLSNIDSTKDASALHLASYNYGILGGDLKKFSNSFRDNISNEKVEVSYCRAITQNGSRIEILNQQWEGLKTPLSELIGSKNLDLSHFWYVLLSTDPFVQIPEGLENEQESLRRKPFTRPAYQLDLISLNDLRSDELANAIPLAKFEKTSSGLKKVEGYIPPCTRINSHERLFIKYEAYDNLMMSLKASSQNIITKINHKRKNRETSPLSDDIDLLCKGYIHFFVNSYDEYKSDFFKNAPPIKLVDFFAKLARVLYHSMETAIDKSHMLKYFNEYATNTSAAEIDKIVSNTFGSHYSHYEIEDSLKPTDKFLVTLNEIFKKLEQLDYRELARKGVVDWDTPTSSYGQNKPPAIKFKRPGDAKNLEDELDD